MKLLRRSTIRKTTLSLLAACVAILMSAPTLWTFARKSQDESRSTSRWETSENGLKRRLEIRGKVEFTDDYADIRDVFEGGYVLIEEERDGQSRRYEVRRALGGPLTRNYFVNGQTRPLDVAARAWVAKIVLDAVRQSGIDAEKRVLTIFRQSGVAGVLAEIDQISGDYAKRRYFEALVKTGNLSATALQQVLQRAARQIYSDYEQAQLLVGVAPILTGNDGAIASFFEAVATIRSDYEHSRVLATLLKRVAPSRELLIQVASSTTSISSDYEKAGVLKKIAPMYLDDAVLRDIIFRTIASIESDYEHRGVLSALLKSGNLKEEGVTRLLDSAVGISSDYEKATLLLEASNAYAGDGRLRGAFLKVVDTIKSDYERGRVLSILLKNKQIG